MNHSTTFDLQTLLDDHADASYDLLAQHVNPAFAKVLRIIGFDIRFTRGQGAYLWDDHDQRYIDCLGGYAVFSLGRNHPTVREALKQAMDMDLPNLLKMGVPRLSGQLARQIIELAPPGLDTVFFGNSGAEGVETALKYARAATGRSRIVHCNKSFHGLTLGALSVMGNAEFRDGFEPRLPKAARDASDAATTAVPFNDLDALEAELRKKDVAGFIVEPIQGKGVNVPDDDYLPGAVELCKKYGALFIADEVQTGYGRTGKMFAVEHWGLGDKVPGPDIMVTAKALSGGYVPVGAVLSKRWIHDKVFSSLDRCVVHSTTFGQNDLAMAAGLATLHVLREENLVERSAAMGRRLMAGLKTLGEKYEMVKEVRGKGLMVAIEFKAPRKLALRTGWMLMHKLDPSLFPQAIIIPLLKDHRILTQTAGHHLDVIKLIPPLVLTEQDVDEIVAGFDDVIAGCHRFPGPAWDVGKRLAQQAMKRQPQPA